MHIVISGNPENISPQFVRVKTIKEMRQLENVESLTITDFDGVNPDELFSFLKERNDILFLALNPKGVFLLIAQAFNAILLSSFAPLRGLNAFNLFLMSEKDHATETTPLIEMFQSKIKEGFKDWDSNSLSLVSSDISTLQDHLSTAIHAQRDTARLGVELALKASEPAPVPVAEDTEVSVFEPLEKPGIRVKIVRNSSAHIRFKVLGLTPRAVSFALGFHQFLASVGNRSPKTIIALPDSPFFRNRYQGEFWVEDDPRASVGQEVVFCSRPSASLVSAVFDDPSFNTIIFVDATQYDDKHFLQSPSKQFFLTASPSLTKHLPLGQVIAFSETPERFPNALLCCIENPFYPSDHHDRKQFWATQGKALFEPLMKVIL